MVNATHHVDKEWGAATSNLNLFTSWSQMSSFTPWQLQPQGNIALFPLDRWLDASRASVETLDKHCPCPQSKALSRVMQSLAAVLLHFLLRSYYMDWKMLSKYSQYFITVAAFPSNGSYNRRLTLTHSYSCTHHGIDSSDTITSHL